MSRNAHLLPQLESFAAMASPGFALMIDAPWGAGKTFAVKDWARNRKHLYVSLYGVGSVEELERAILLARLAIIDNGTARAITSLLSAGVEALAAHYNVKKQLKLSDLGQAVLPKLVIFDDLERTDMPLNELLSALNRYVEHEKRNVILLANREELRSKAPDVYDVTSEKVVGRSVYIVPEVDEASMIFLKEVEEWSDVHDFLSKESGVLLSVFDASKSCNLRLLRQAILEFSRFFRQIPLDIRDRPGFMSRLLATFAALSIAFHGVEGFGEDGLSQEYEAPRGIEAFSKKKEEETAKTGVDLFHERFRDHPHVRLYGSVISPKLALEWIGRGHAADEVVAEELRSAPDFRENGEAWRTLWHWPRRRPEEIVEAIGQIKTQLAAREIRDPAVIMHLVGISLSLGENAVEWTSRAAAVGEMRAYISALEAGGLFPEIRAAVRRRGPLFQESAYGLGFAQRESAEFAEIEAELTAALERAFWRASSARAKQLLKLMTENVDDFASVIDNQGRRSDLPNYAHEPVLAAMDVDEAVRVIFGMHPEAVLTALAPFERRWERMNGVRELLAVSEGVWPDERAWMRQFKATAEVFAAELDPLRAAQVRRAIKWHLSFMDEADEGVSA